MIDESLGCHPAIPTIGSSPNAIRPGDPLMCPLRLVEDADAGPDAVGILVPPCKRTVVILRPRALIWDLLLTEEGLPRAGSPFRELTQMEACAAPRRIYAA